MHLNFVILVPFKLDQFELQLLHSSRTHQHLFTCQVSKILGTPSSHSNGSAPFRTFGAIAKATKYAKMGPHRVSQNNANDTCGIKYRVKTSASWKRRGAKER
jgi:hypothetical protein